MNKIDFAVGIGGENGQGIASTGNILALIFARRGLHLNAYNAYQSIIRGGHTFLTIRASDGAVRNIGDKIDVFIPLNQDTMDRHLHLLKSGACAIYDKEKVTPGKAADGVQLCPMPMKELTKGNKLAVNTAALGATLQLLGIESEPLETVIARQFKKKGDAVVAENLAIARAGYDYAAQNFTAFSWKAPRGAKALGIITGNQAIAMGGAAAGVKFYAAYPMSPSTGVLMWMAAHARELGIMVRQVEDEIGVMNMVIGAAHTGCRAMCATSGGGFALMTEAVGMAGMPGYIFTAATDEHDEDGTLISDEFTNPQKRRMMVEKRARKMQGAINDIAPPKLVGPEQADVTLVGWGSTAGVIREAVEKLAGEEGIVANQLAIKWIVPLHAAEIGAILGRSKNVILVENNQSGQFARFLRSETGFAAHGHIRKYDGEPFMPHHIVEAVKAQLAGQTRLSVPVHEVNA